VELVLRVVHKHDDAADASLGGIVVEKGDNSSQREREREILKYAPCCLEESLLLSITKEHL
jgi:hypothetical protein